MEKKLICAEGFIPRRLHRNKGDETRVQLPYENNIPRCLRRGMLIFREAMRRGKSPPRSSPLARSFATPSPRGAAPKTRLKFRAFAARNSPSKKCSISARIFKRVFQFVPTRI